MAALVLAATMAAPAAADVPGAQVVGFLNAQRAANGLPAGIAEDAARSDACAKHAAYEAATGGVSRAEDPTHPAFTPEGDAAARSALLYGPGLGPWTAQRNPFELAPIHLHQLLAPRLDRLGAAEVDGYGCVTATRGRPAPPADVTYTYPGDGAVNWPPAQVAREAPATPGQLAGLPEGAVTGPYLYVSFDGPTLAPTDRADAVSATLTGPDGPVTLDLVDNGTPGLQGLLPTGVQLIPRAPLAPLTSYRAAVTADVATAGGSRRFSRTWTFTTGLRQNRVAFTRATVVDGRLTVAASSDAPGATVGVTGPGTAAETRLGADGTAALVLDDHGFWTACLRSGGGTTGYETAETCIEVGVPRAGKAQLIDLPRTSPRRRPIVLRIATEQPVDVAYRALTRDGVLVSRGGRRTLDAGTWSLPIRIGAGYDGRGRRLQVRVLVLSGGEVRLVRRAVRLR